MLPYSLPQGNQAITEKVLEKGIWIVRKHYKENSFISNNRKKVLKTIRKVGEIQKKNLFLQEVLYVPDKVGIPDFHVDYKYIDGDDIYHHLTSHTPLFERYAWVYFIADELESLHNSDFIHRDITPRNVVIDKRGYPHIIDYDDIQLAAQPMLTSNPHGTGLYHSPEIISRKIYSKESDVYAFGGLIYYIMTECEPAQYVQAKMKDYESRLAPISKCFEARKKIKKKLGQPVEELAEYVKTIIDFVTQYPDDEYLKKFCKLEQEEELIYKKKTLKNLKRGLIVFQEALQNKRDSEIKELMENGEATKDMLRKYNLSNIVMECINSDPKRRRKASEIKILVLKEAEHLAGNEKREFDRLIQQGILDQAEHLINNKFFDDANSKLRGKELSEILPEFVDRRNELLSKLE